VCTMVCMSSVFALPRNDVEACERFHAERGQITKSELRVMMRLQDDDSKLLEIAKTWRVVDDEPARDPEPAEARRPADG